MMRSSSLYDADNPAVQPLIDRLRAAGKPAALMDEQFNTLWVSSQEAMQYLTLCMLQLPAGDALNAPLLPVSHPMKLTRANPPMLCYAEIVTFEERTYYQFTFKPVENLHIQEPDDMMALLTALNDFTDYQVSEILHTAETLREMRSEQDAARIDSAVLRLETAAAALSDRVLHLREMQWYETVQNAGNADFRVQNIAEMLFGFSEGVSILLGNALEIVPAQVATGLYAKVDPKRLEFILLTAVGMLKNAAPKLNKFSFRAQQTEQEIRIVLQFSRSRKRLPKDVLRELHSAETDTSASSDLCLIRQFCSVFHAEWKTSISDTCAEGTLTLPAFEPADTVVTVCQPTDYRAERFRYFSSYPTRLSAYFALKYLRL